MLLLLVIIRLLSHIQSCFIYFAQFYLPGWLPDSEHIARPDRILGTLIQSFAEEAKHEAEMLDKDPEEVC